MNFGPVQTGIFYLIVGSGAIVGVPDRIGAVMHEPSATNLMLAFISSGVVFLLAMLKMEAF